MTALMLDSNDITDDAMLAKLFDACQQISPYLKGELASPRSEDVAGGEQDLAVIQQLYDAIAEQTPEAGHSYWLARCWSLLLWQPLYIAMIGTYEFGCVPSFKGFSQKRHSVYIMGFGFERAQIYSANQASLIKNSGQQLKPLFDHYREQIDRWKRCPLSFTQVLLADSILANLVLLQKLKPEFSGEQILQQGKQWLAAFSLSENYLSAFNIADDGSLNFVRRSCCLVYKTQGGELCSDCPRLHRQKINRK
ncbi:siderophore ferric iron reductase [Reinekea thalattae]|uniref:Siderophore ferric iron reductase n=1 Tax=Reinekea thalattae TaxID=2593301 RepID=A0A5C8ZB33_9GAMM|nr:siderophore ferric iron reductase [Reinekea thalattae]TXR54401.1 siderophore ferric iron reductase [Reinekea thalattae]